MDIKRSLVTKIELTNLIGLDPVQVIAEDLKSGVGRLTISCFGKAWTSTWGGIGFMTLIEFVASSHVDYLAGKLMPTYNKYETDWEKISTQILGAETSFLAGVDETTAYMYEDDLEVQYGEGGDWRCNLPQRETADYIYLCRVIAVVLAAFKEITDG